jgi:hypothetical protein
MPKAMRIDASTVLAIQPDLGKAAHMLRTASGQLAPMAIVLLGPHGAGHQAHATLGPLMHCKSRGILHECMLQRVACSKQLAHTIWRTGRCVHEGSSWGAHL